MLQVAALSLTLLMLICKSTLSVSAIIYYSTALRNHKKTPWSQQQRLGSGSVLRMWINAIIQDINWELMCKYWRLKHEQVWAEFWSVRHVIRVVRPAGASLREVWIRRKSSLQAQVPARLQPFPYRFFPPLSLLKTHPASLNVTSHHHIVTPDCTLCARIRDVFLPHVSSWNANTGLSRTRGCFNHRVSSSDEQTASWPITRRAAILRHVLPTGQGYPEFI